MYAGQGLFGIMFFILCFATLFLVSPSAKSLLKPHRFSKKSPNMKRSHPRYKTSLRVKYKTPSGEGISWIRDIGRGGSKLFLNKALKTLKKEDALQIEINLPGNMQPIFIKGYIVWSNKYNAGFQFDKVIEGDIDEILRYIDLPDRENVF